LLPFSDKKSNLKTRLAAFMKTSEVSDEIKLVDWTGILSEQPIGIAYATPAQALQKLLEEKWKLKPTDLDMIVMQHCFEFTDKYSAKKKLTSSLVVKGDDATYTAMAKTVGLPLAITSKLILNGAIKSRGVVVPVTKEIYEPVLKELEENNIVFRESE